MNASNMKEGVKKIFFASSIVVFACSFALDVHASSHREAPMISSDPQADTTDFYMWVSSENTNKVNFVSCVNPLSEPAGGPNFHHFGDDVRYEIHIDNDGDAQEDITYRFEFTTTRSNDNTFLYNTGTITSLNDPDWNVKQTYQVTRIEDGKETVLGENLISPPANIGDASTPNYASLSDAAIQLLNNGSRAIAGPFDDPFFVDLGGVFDLLGVRGSTGIDGLKGYNASCIVLEESISNLTAGGVLPEEITDSAAIIGAWSATYRQSTKVLRPNGQSPEYSGEWVQVSRLGQPLVNEVIIPLGQKDLFNASHPSNDAQFANFVANPEVGMLLNLLFGVSIPPQGPFGSDEQRVDLIATFLTGLEGLNQPENVVPSEQLRLNVAIKPVVNPRRLGVLGADIAGFPNGRRLTDDVTDIALQAIAGAVYPLFDEGFDVDPLAKQLGDGVHTNDVPFRSEFPYLALPHQGLASVAHGSGDVVIEETTVVEEIIGIGAGDIVKSVDSPAVYYIGEGTRHLFPNEAIFKAWGYQFNQVLVVKPGILNKFNKQADVPARPGAMMIKSAESPAVYVVDGVGAKRMVANETVARGLFDGDGWQEFITIVSKSHLDSYPTVAPVTEVSDYNRVGAISITLMQLL